MKTLGLERPAPFPVSRGVCRKAQRFALAAPHHAELRELAQIFFAGRRKRGDRRKGACLVGVAKRFELSLQFRDVRLVFPPQRFEFFQIALPAFWKVRFFRGPYGFLFLEPGQIIARARRQAAPETVDERATSPGPRSTIGR